MKVQLEEATEKRTFPYLVNDPARGLVLVGRYSAIILDPSYDGDGWSFEDDPPVLSIFDWVPLQKGSKVTLTQT